MEHVYKFFANLIREGSFFFKDLAKRYKLGVKKVLKENGREDLATDSNAKPEE